MHIVFVLNHNYQSPLGRVLQWVNTVCLFNSFPQQWKKDAISVEATYILVNTIRQFSIVIQSHESSLPPLEKIKENGKKYRWELSPLKLQSNNLPVHMYYLLCMTGPWCLRFSIPPHRKFITADIQQCSLHYQLINDSDWITYQATARLCRICLLTVA